MVFIAHLLRDTIILKTTIQSSETLCGIYEFEDSICSEGMNQWKMVSLHQE